MYKVFLLYSTVLLFYHKKNFSSLTQLESIFFQFIWIQFLFLKVFFNNVTQLTEFNVIFWNYFFNSDIWIF